MAEDVTAGIRAAGVQFASPLDTVSKVVGIGNDITRNRLLNQSILNQQQELANAQLTNQKGQYDLLNAVLNRTSASAMGVLAKSDADLTGQGGYDAIKAAADDEIKNHPGSTQAQHGHDTFVGSIPPPIQPDGTPTPSSVYRQFVYQKGQTAMSAKEQIEMLRPGLTMTPAGNRIVPVTTPSGAQQLVNPGAQPTFNEGTGTQSGSIPIGASPAIHPVFVPNPDDPSGKTGTTEYQPVRDTGGVPGAPAPAGAPAGGVPPAGGGTGGGRTAQLAAPPLGAGAQVEKNIESYNTDAGKVQTSWTQIRVAQQAREALSQAQTGKGTQDWYNLGQTLQSWGWVPDGSAWAKSINNQAEAVKLTSQLLMANPVISSDAKMAEMLKGSATTGIPNPVAQSILRDNIITPARMFLAQVQQTTDPQSYTGSHAPGINDYNGHVANFQMSMGTMGQLAYTWDMLNPAEKAAVRTNLEKHPKLKEQFLKHLGLAKRYFFPDYSEEGQ